MMMGILYPITPVQVQRPGFFVPRWLDATTRGTLDPALLGRDPPRAPRRLTAEGDWLTVALFFAQRGAAAMATGDIIHWGAEHPPDWRLAHNPVQPVSVDQEHGDRGFRVLWVPPGSEDWVECPCGWRPELGVHYHHKGAKHEPIKATALSHALTAPAATGR